jgi:hypothetical protein
MVFETLRTRKCVFAVFYKNSRDCDFAGLQRIAAAITLNIVFSHAKALLTTAPAAAKVEQSAEAEIRCQAVRQHSLAFAVLQRRYVESFLTQ